MCRWLMKKLFKNFQLSFRNASQLVSGLVEEGRWIFLKQLIFYEKKIMSGANSDECSIFHLVPIKSFIILQQQPIFLMIP